MERFLIKSPTSQAVFNAVSSYITKFNWTVVLISDLGSEFASQIFSNFTQTLKTSIIHASPRHSQTRRSSNRIIKNINNKYLRWRGL